ncbi:hypothetical protein JAAARDRAFT_199965 [Jaapia argillacea MUCL 33604]|uniref:GATA-type domain-containing protein n=1 Tax=Jaapia argillacea MUCL 33604 TaxID=933084 RepID=A0A067P9B4_9AGAM|nr:hypothetical protein JAAARDRAFT_199965 [Jaapia argillacea MUCL 33604]
MHRSTSPPSRSARQPTDSHTLRSPSPLVHRLPTITPSPLDNPASAGSLSERSSSSLPTLRPRETLERSDSSSSDQEKPRRLAAIRDSDHEQSISAARDSSYLPYSHHQPPPTHHYQHTMSHRTDTLVSRPYYGDHRQHDFSRSHHPSPPPIATLPHSPSLSVSSLDRSSVSSPAPPGPGRHLGFDRHHHHHPDGGYPPHPSSSYYPQSHPHNHHQPLRQSPKPYYHPYPPPHHHQQVMDAPPPPQNYSYGPPQRVYENHGYRAPPPSHPDNHMGSPMVPTQGYSTQPLPGVAHITPPTMRSPYAPQQAHMPGQTSDYGIVLTDDASTKLSDRVRRRCFNCCTTDTSTWRRSTLNPGKVLCNKCGLFERTHSRPRPDQFPHKRGHLASSASASASTSTPATPSTASSTPAVPARSRGSPPSPLPPHMSPASGGSPGQQHQLPPMNTQPPAPLAPPHSYTHPSIAPLLNRVDSSPHSQAQAPRQQLDGSPHQQPQSLVESGPSQQQPGPWKTSPPMPSVSSYNHTSSPPPVQRQLSTPTMNSRAPLDAQTRLRPLSRSPEPDHDVKREHEVEQKASRSQSPAHSSSVPPTDQNDQAGELASED